jgi:nucleoid-associated protein YgaU
MIGANRRRVGSRNTGGPQGLNMKAILIGKSIAPAFLVGTASVAAIVYALSQIPRGESLGTGGIGVMSQPSQPEAGTGKGVKDSDKDSDLANNTPAPAAAPSSSSNLDSAADGAKAAASPALASTETNVAALAKDLAGPPPAPPDDPSVPSFDLARVEAGGDAVIAGRAVPGATVDLMRNGERLDRVVADASGQFVMVPPRLPAGNYELTLDAKLPDGTIASSKQSVTVTIKEADATGSVPASAPTQAAPAQAALAAHAPAPSASSVTKPRATAVIHPRQVMASASPGEGASGSITSGSTRIVTRGDSLWRISRITYGAGEQYAVVYQANRDRIQNPNVIRPGQVLVLPVKQR